MGSPARAPDHLADLLRPRSVPIGLVIEASKDTTEVPVSRPRIALWIATGAGSGYAPIAPGTFGSAVGVVVYLPLAGLGLPLYLASVLVITLIGIWAAGIAEQVFATKDDGRIVIDEIAGQLITLLPLIALAPRVDALGAGWLLFGFLVFRFFDIWKPGPARWAERNFPGGSGVVLDDVVAGIFGAAVVAAVAWGWSL